MRLIAVAVIGLGAAAVGCSTVDTSGKLKAATSAIDAAKSAGAENVPAAKTLLDQASGYLSTGQSQIAKGNGEDALRSLSLASAAASDAKVTATEATSRAKVDSLQQQIADLRAKLGK
jgi:hypothetical protein